METCIKMHAWVPRSAMRSATDLEPFTVEFLLEF